MLWLWFLLIAVAAIMFVWGAVSPRSQWQTMQAWAYRNSEANEPSDAAYMLTRLGAIVGLIILVVAVVNLWALV